MQKLRLREIKWLYNYWVIPYETANIQLCLMVQPHSKWQSLVSNAGPKTTSSSMWLRLCKWLPWNLLQRAFEGLNEIMLVLCLVHRGAPGTLVLFVLTFVCHSHALGRQSTVSEQMWSVRLGGRGHRHLPDPLPGTWKSSSSSPRPPHPSAHQSPHLSLRSLYCWADLGHSLWASSRERGDRHWPLLLPVPSQPQQMHFINRPLPWRS